MQETEQALRQIDDWVAKADEQAARAQRLQQQTQALQVVEHSRDHSVAVTVDSAGNVAGLALTEAALDLGPDRLAASVLATMRAAQARMADRVVALAADTLGAGSAAADHLSASYRARFGSAEEDR